MQASTPAAAGIFVCILRGAPCVPRLGGETGIRSGLKIRRPQGHAGSSPAPGTTATGNVMRDQEPISLADARIGVIGLGYVGLPLVVALDRGQRK